MATPVKTTHRGARSFRRQAVTAPQWNTVSLMPGSNTLGAGPAVRPTQNMIASRRRLISGEERTFESVNLWDRMRTRTRIVLRSPGVVLLGGISALLFIGLSPVIAAEPYQSDVPESSVESSVHSEVGANTQEVTLR